MIFRYKTGEVVKEGDSVVLSGRVGYIGEVIQPRTSMANDYSCYETGGVFFTDDLSITPGWILLTKTEDAEDLLYVGRSDVEY